MDLLNKDAILKGRTFRSAYVKAFGGSIKIQELSGPQRDEMDIFVAKFNKAHGEEECNRHYTTFWILFSVVDEDGKRVFADSDFDAVAALPGSDCRRVWRHIAKINDIGEDDEDDEGNP